MAARGRFAVILLLGFVLAGGAALAEDAAPANQPPAAAADPAKPAAPVSVPEFGDVKVVPWEVEDKWVYGGDRFHKINRFYQPLDAGILHPWVITRIDIKTWFQQDVIDGFAPSLEPLIGEKWKDVKKFMETHKYGGSCHFVYAATDRKFTIYHDQGKPREQKLELDVLEGGPAKFFVEPKRENFTNVDGMKPDDAHKAAVARYAARLAWAESVRKSIPAK